MGMTAHILLVNALVLFVFMTLIFVIARARDRLDTVDSAWGLAYIVAAWAVVLQARSGRGILVAILITIWGLRLTRHLFIRSARRGKDDPRYQEMRAEWKGNVWLRAYGVVFLLQGFLVWIISIPVVMVAGQLLPRAHWLNGAGVILWLIGFITESVADHQLTVFVENQKVKKTKNAVLDTGLWRYSRHPNYFGELTQWWAIGLIACQTSFGWVGLLGPLVLTITIVLVSGIPPIESRRKSNPEYRKYMARTSPLIPWLRRTSK
jgi:steroid 5-alpha reductase family enzyme